MNSCIYLVKREEVTISTSKKATSSANAALETGRKEYGEADIAILMGEKPTILDNIVMPLFTTELVSCAHKTYVGQYGMPEEKALKYGEGQLSCG